MTTGEDSGERDQSRKHHYRIVEALAAGLLITLTMAPIFAPIVVPISVLWENFPRFLYPLSAILAAVMFHLFSTGNAAYSAGMNYHSDRLFEFGNRISDTAMGVGMSSGAMLGSAVLFTFSADVWVSELRFLAICTYLFGAILFCAAISNHKPDHKWFSYIQTAIEDVPAEVDPDKRTKKMRTEIESQLDGGTDFELTHMRLVRKMTRSGLLAVGITYVLVGFLFLVN